MTDHTFQNQDDLLVIAAWMYYEDGLTHRQIAEELSMSRVTVTRLLQKARREGIVQVKITRPLPSHYELSQRLIKTFGIKRAIIVKNAYSHEETLDRIGRTAAEHLKELLCGECSLGFAWSTTVRYMAPYLGKPDKPVHVTIHELAGSMLGQDTPYSISSKVAETLGAALKSLPVPVIVNNPATYQALMKEKSIKEALDQAAKCDTAFVGLGDVGDQCTMVKTGYLTPQQMEDLRRQGAVGDVLLRYYDINGQHVYNPLEPHIISLNWEQLNRIPYMVALASGPSKIQAIQGALRGGWVSCLVSDEDTVQQVLQSANRRS